MHEESVSMAETMALSLYTKKLNHLQKELESLEKGKQKALEKGKVRNVKHLQDEITHVLDEMNKIEFLMQQIQGKLKVA